MKPKRRYDLLLPDELADHLEEIADARHTTRTEVIKACIKLGLIAHQASITPGAELIYREGDQERKIVWL